MTTLACGFGRRDITPAMGVPMWGYMDRPGPAEGTLDRLYAKVLVFRCAGTTVALAVLDLGRPPMDDVRAAISERAAGIGVDHVTYLATHTHHAPVMEDSSAPFMAPLADAISDAIAEAVANLRPVTLFEGEATVDIGHNRRLIVDDRCQMLWRNAERKPTAPVDTEARLFQVRDDSGGLLCTIVHFACHPVVMGPSNRQYSADWPGEMSRLVEESTGAPCVFIQGGCGDINPYLDKTPLDQGGVDSMRQTGREAAEAVLTGLKDMRPLPHDAAEVSWTTRPVSIGTRWDFSDGDQRALFSSFYGEIFEKVYVLGADGDLTIPVDLVMLNRALAFVAIPGEVYVSDQLSLKTTGPLRHTLVCGYGNGYYAYFPPVGDAIRGGYGGTVGSMAGWGAAERIQLEAKLGLVAMLGEVGRRATQADFVIVDAK